MLRAYRGIVAGLPGGELIEPFLGLQRPHLPHHRGFGELPELSALPVDQLGGLAGTGWAMLRS